MSLSKQSPRNVSLRDLSGERIVQRFARHSSIYMSLPVRGSRSFHGKSQSTVDDDDSTDFGQTVGYCYLRLFHVLFDGDHDVVELKENVARKLGVYPQLRDVFFLLLDTLIKRRQSVSDGFLPELTRVSNSLFHVRQRISNLMTIDDFVKQYSQFFGCRIGAGKNGKTNEEKPVVGTALREVSRKIGVNYEGLAHRVIARQMSVPTNFDFQSLITQDVQSLLEAQRRLPEQRINNILNKDDEQILVRLFGERYSLVFTSKFPHPHAMADSVRQLERIDMMNLVSYSYFHDKSAELGAQVINVGGNYSNAFNREWTQMHSCCPLLDARDQTRNVVRRQMLQQHKKLSESKRIILRDIVESQDPMGCKFFCHRKSQDCKVRSNGMILVHSAYDMTTTELADTFVAHQVDVAHAVMVFDESMLTDSEGRIETLHMNWKRYDKSGADRKSVV